MKKLINKVDDVVRESLEGVAAAHPGLLRVDPDLKVVIRADAPAETMARLALVAATATVIRSGLGVMGVAPVEEMR